MKILVFKKLSLMSSLEKSARVIEFDPKVTVVKGENSTGKSSLMKSIYWALGADPATQHDSWKALNISALLEFYIDEDRYFAVRNGGRIGLFNSRGKCEIATGRMTREFAPILSKRLSFNLKLKARDGKSEIPLPAFCFLPFYVDQDRGWQNPMQSFDRLSQYKNWHNETIAYHAGIRPKEYYELIGSKSELEVKKSEISSEERALKRAYEKVVSSRTIRPLTPNMEKFHKAVGEFLSQLKALDSDRLKITSHLSKLSSKKASLEKQSAIAKAALSELDKDYKFIRDQFSETIECPTCGSEHENSFANRYSIMEDGEECRNFLIETREEIDVIDKKMNSLNSELGQNNFRKERINNLLEQERGKLKLKDVIAAEGEQRAREVLKEELQELQKVINEINEDIKKVKDNLNIFNDPERKKVIYDFFSGHMQKNLRKLDVMNLPESDYKTIKSKVHDTGSNQPRAVLAYYFAFLNTLMKFSSSPICPLVLDTPNQQDQDSINSKKIIEFIFKSCPEQCQLILGTVSLQGVENPGKTICLNEKHSILRKSEYENVAESMKNYLDALS